MVHYLLRLILVCTIYISNQLASYKEALGITTKFWTQTSQEDFNKGQINNISIYSSGEIALAPKIETFNGINASYVWSMARDGYGNIFVGAGDPGKVYKLTEQKGAIEVFRLEDGLNIQSLAIDPRGNIFAGVSPNGVIYKIDRYMDAGLFCVLPERYIWDMVIDSSGNLFAATGDTGKIYKINEKGAASIFLDSQASHILDLEIDDKDVIYACTEPFGLVYRIAPDGESLVIFDADEDEIHCLTLGKDGNLYIGTAAGRKSMILSPAPVESVPPAFPTQAAPFLVEEEQDDFWFRSGSRIPPYSRNKVEDIKKTDGYKQWLKAQHERDDSGFIKRRWSSSQDESGRPQTQQKTMEGYYSLADGLSATRNAVYMISQDGRVKKLLDLDRTFIFTIASDEANNIYAGTGNHAMIYKITSSSLEQDKGSGHDQTSILLRREQLHILSSLISDGSLYVGTGNSGSVFKVSNLFSTNGIYESPVYDTLVTSRWGRISWDASLDKGTRITLSIRTGNSHVPDSTWSDWSKEYVAGNEAIDCPPGRFIQYRAMLSTIYSNATPILKDVSIAYLPANQPPNISRLEISYDEESPPAIASKNQAEQGINKILFPTSLERRRSLIKTHSKRTIKWEADDPDNDRLLFDLYYKLIDKNEWKMLSQGIYDQNAFEWETMRVPDGKYQIKILASDHLDNPENDSLITEITSQPFVIDNTSPIISDITVYRMEDERLQISGAVSDNISNISTIQYSVDHTDWVSIFTNDQIFDYSQEEFQFAIPNLIRGEHTVAIDAIDQEGNVGSAEVDISLR